ncbi:flagellar biosynthetic protein FliO [Lysobacter humi (ex Lee et al. 2017)]
MPATAAAPKVSFPVKPATTAQVVRPVGASTPAQADAGSIGGALFSLVLVVGLILGLGWLARRMPGLQRGGSASQLKVVASVALGPRERAMVVDVGGQQLLLGVGQGGVRTLHVLEQPLPAVEANTSTSPFAQVLAQHFGRKS